MTSAEQRSKAQALRDLHSGPRILVLPNVWDPFGARVLESTGYPAVATASAAISSSLGFQDGEKVSRSTMLEIVSRISRAVDVPVTADMESGYGESPAEVGETTRALIETGAVGMNIEDSLQEGGVLRPIEQQAERIATVRETAVAQGLHLLINARIDSFLADRFPEQEERIEETVRRAEVYARAGADCIYPIGPGDAETLTLLRSRIALPLNALATPGAAPLETMAAIGINRVSFGPFIFRSCFRKFADIAHALARSGGYECFGREMMTRAEAAAYLTSEREDVPVVGEDSWPMANPAAGERSQAALLELVRRLADADVVWALTGSQAHALQGVPLDVHDIDVQTDEEGAYRIGEILKDTVVRPVEWRQGGSVRSHFGEFRLLRVSVEVMGALQKRLPDGSWEQPVDVSTHRVVVDFRGHRVPVLSLEYEWQAYERLGRHERAALLRQYAAQPP